MSYRATHGSSCGMTLVFPEKAIHDEYERKLKNLQMETYAIIREKHGIWAGNQDKFVPNPEDMNQFDPTHMETLYDRRKRQNEIFSTNA